MKKDELVHLHSLFWLLRQDYEQRGIASPEQFSGYDELGVSPMAVYTSKAGHKEAVGTLADELAAASCDGDERSAAVSSPS